MWVLYGLVVLPHTTRYNHVFLLPAMAWLWRDGQTGRRLAIIAYVLAALSRLNHLWAILLPALWGPLASGFGLYAVLILSAGIIERLRNQQASHVWQEGTQPSRHDGRIVLEGEVQKLIRMRTERRRPREDAPRPPPRLSASWPAAFV